MNLIVRYLEWLREQPTPTQFIVPYVLLMAFACFVALITIAIDRWLS
jgi:hypothetical protein